MMKEKIKFENLSGWLKFAAIASWIYAGVSAFWMMFLFIALMTA
jgi:hypothetical protein